MADYVVLLSADEPSPDDPSGGGADILVAIDAHIQLIDQHIQELDQHVQDLDDHVVYNSNYYDCLPLYVESQATYDRAHLSYLSIFLCTFFSVFGIITVYKIGKWIEFLVCDR